MTMPEQFGEVAYIAISDEDGNEYQFCSITDTIDIAWGARDIEQIPMLCSGRVSKLIPEESTEITLELYPVGISSSGTTPNGLHGWYMGLSPTATSGIITTVRKRFRVAVLWTTVSSISNAAGAIGSGDSLRFSFWNCYMTSATLDFTDDILKSTVVFKCLPYNRAGSGMIKAEEVDGGTLSTLGTYSGAAPS